MPHAVIVAHGQPSDPAPAEAALAAFAQKIDSLCHRVSVSSATLAAPRALEECLDNLPDGTTIYPLFMARGWFVTSALPKRIGARSVTVLDPLGIDPDLPALATAALHQELTDRRWVASETHLVIAAHGSGRSPNPAAVASDFADKLGQMTPFKTIRTGFVEQSPSIAEAATACEGNALCLPFFACTGGHVLEDVPQELARAGFKGHVMPVVSELPQIQLHIAARLDTL
ncbi:cobalamin (vitamin B12) biosynthesis CbiX protein [Ruegeria sp. ANG-R]|uniref:CbiX/SirB N-terminal domain-containing protein n=1 Tax=Ruegeria sp. ANG-R TaxID=1577903 RepID=UPI00057DA706|nr:CbiX/SirB N-terminal domain-containing protein [Ruegeria sp. ANG-R]KIC42114.1 cobalamin (vitamin B12) biosynthesis CbiX protein [Ruegeria sp. ANG-R]